MYRVILVRPNGSSFRKQGLPSACEIVLRARAILRLAHVHMLSSSPIYIEGQQVIDENLASLIRGHGRVYLEKTRERLAAMVTTGINLRVEFVERTVKSPISQPLGSFLATHVARRQANLVVMATHSRGGLEGFRLGGVAGAFVRLSQAPVLLLSPTEDAGDSAPPPLFRQIFIPLDGLERAEQVLEPALPVGDLMQTEYTSLCVVGPPRFSGARYAGSAPRPYGHARASQPDRGSQGLPRSSGRSGLADPDARQPRGSTRLFLSQRCRRAGE